ncbi:bifunctional helix-turn-helix transcriptional regulator/GNAT family N-acetyltransferase [Siphonobacter sp. SORGH_AS_0500]|uniref:bifunctional helix-turn-helix transcriptional regulator/GNAT family N-acetyltransferase n=1 Tax=Siphonobacter sp. SORGH_AS_0500 TaxID=1864824 RepID=UPI0028668AD5|nr:bifunctional helix-turn-helix transcriptional regulator/GNAT family N-acetyltransferase [Siphonobacter sp. SORGH_AS_0500]MDR6197638.1 DNA-binding MarR family transcriptional regulator/N-acetylglutamate synthase-like GNAT family acetyltransferase [Siphonobacter sp. SORGH_AS_0500]
MNFFQRTGPMALGSRLRQMSERMTQEAARIYGMYDLEMEPRWFPVLYSLGQNDGQSVAQLAEDIGHSQASVSQIIKEMAKQDYITITKGTTDARKTIVTLSDKSRQQLPALDTQMKDVAMAVETMLAQTQHNLWKALDELDYYLDQQGLFDRVNQQRKQRESQQVVIVPYSEEYHDAFRSLNVEWITAYFKMEVADYQALDHPNEKILDRGGFIYIALYEGEPLGCCALIKMDDYTYELAKMAVSPKAQGKHMGYLLGKSILQKAKELGAEKVYLESNTLLKPAIRLYHKLGFQQVQGYQSPYERCNIQMEVKL